MPLVQLQPGVRQRANPMVGSCWRCTYFLVWESQKVDLPHFTPFHRGSGPCRSLSGKLYRPMVTFRIYKSRVSESMYGLDGDSLLLQN